MESAAEDAGEDSHDKPEVGHDPDELAAESGGGEGGMLLDRVTRP